MKALIFLVTLAALLTGCAHSYTANSVLREAPLRTNAAALVAVADDGRFEKIVYPGSGRQTTLAVSRAFSSHLARVDTSPATATFEQHLSAARAGGFDYLIVPVLVHWEDRATEWSGRADRIEIELRTVDAPSGRTLALGSVAGKSKWATFGGDAPEDLLITPLATYADWLFSAPGTALPMPSEPAHARPANAQSAGKAH